MKKKHMVKIGLRMIIGSILPFDCLRNDDGIVLEKAMYNNTIKFFLAIKLIKS